MACYFSQDNELNCSPLIQILWALQKSVFLPAITASDSKKLEFAAYGPNDSLRLNQYKILEPYQTETIPPEALDLVLMPLVGFDLQGNRLGMGGGYYDRTFQHLRQSNKKPFLLGVGYELQKINQLPDDPWDVKMDGVLTEKKLYIFDR